MVPENVYNKTELLLLLIWDRGSYDDRPGFRISWALLFGVLLKCTFVSGVLFIGRYSFSNENRAYNCELKYFFSIILSRFLELRGIVLVMAIANTLTCLITLFIFKMMSWDWNFVH